jgi:hypothetical protein
VVCGWVGGCNSSTVSVCDHVRMCVHVCVCLSVTMCVCDCVMTLSVRDHVHVCAKREWERNFIVLNVVYLIVCVNR